MPIRLLLLSVLTILLLNDASGQSLSNLRRKIWVVTSDTLSLDSLSIVPGSLAVSTLSSDTVSTGFYKADWVNSRVFLDRKKLNGIDTVIIRYRVFPFGISAEKRNKQESLFIGKGTLPDPFKYQPSSDKSFSFFQDKSLSANGSISRGISFGNNQDVFVNSSLNLQLAGPIGNGVELVAAITDENIPVQPEGNTQQLQEFDRVFIQLSLDRSKLIAGDFELRRPDSYFMNFFKRGQGAFASSSFNLTDTTKSHKTRRMNTAASLAIAKGRFTRKVFQGVEGNQVPYRLSGNEGESFIVVLSGTEKVFIDGQLLVRGVQNDYVIDYNTAEITFMPKRLITKDIRIIVEYEYTDRNYVRSMYYVNNEFVTDRVKLKFNLYSEQDSKNQPLLQDVDSARKAVMASVGDSIDLAYYPTADSLDAFNESIVLYIRKDTIASNGSAYGIFEYSTDAQSARWQVTFSEVGSGKGDYIQDLRTANGRVFKWVEPVNGISQGNYMPVQLLVTPKQRRMATLGGDFILSRNKSLNVELARSDNDVNLYSQIAKKNDQGNGVKIRYDGTNHLGTDTLNGWRLNQRLDYEFTSKNFRPLEPFRNPEFVRDWNTTGLSNTFDENILTAELAISNSNNGTAGYRLKTYQRGSQYSGWNQGIFSDLRWKDFSLKGYGNILTTTGTNNTDFLRHQFDLSKKLGKKWTLGLRDLAEDNRYKSTNGDSLQSNSYAWQEWVGYGSFADSTNNKAVFSYKYRTDRGPRGDKLYRSALAQEASLVTELGRNPKHTFRNTATYRDLRIIDPQLINATPLRTLVNRIDHQVQLMKGAFTAITFYEISSGRDRKQEFYYLEVPAGQGSFAYIGDLNGNSVQDLNEFAPANFTDQARYIRVFFNSDEYVDTRSNSFSEVLNMNPSFLKKQNSKTRVWHRFSNQFLLRLDKKTAGESVLSALNPFSRKLDDSLLVSTQSNLRNTLFFNRNDPGYGADYTWQDLRNKVLLVNGFDYRKTVQQQITLRWNINRSLQTIVAMEKEDRLNASEFFPDRNYRLKSASIEPRLVFQPNTSWRISGSYGTGNKENTEGNFETLKENRISLEVRANTVNSGTLNAKVNYINLEYNGQLNSFMAYELLGGLKPGSNFTWTVSALKNLNQVMQLNLNYEGRKSEDSKTIHTGNVQFRAFF
ncbi:MAG: hypothetical protein ACKOKF_13015 [Bacteroidota bacterium]